MLIVQYQLLPMLDLYIKSNSTQVEVENLYMNYLDNTNIDLDLGKSMVCLQSVDASWHPPRSQLAYRLITHTSRLVRTIT